MTATPHMQNQISEQEYLDGEKLSDIHHEYVDGYVYAMASASKRHHVIAGNLFAALLSMSRGSTCTAYQSDIKVRAVSDKSYFYPDVVVGCEEDNADDYYLEKPCLIVEVLSDSTEKRDRREKLLAYMNITSLQAYIMVAQDKPEVELYYREEAGNWRVKVFENLEDKIVLPCMEQEVKVAEIYEDVFS